MPISSHRSSFLLLFSVISLLSITSAQGSGCDNPCYDYNQILDSCIHDGFGSSSYYSCVCNSDNFNSTVQECIACTGTGSAAADTLNKCQTVAPDCNVACYEYSQILAGCGDASSSGFNNCVCSAAYDINNGGVFNQQIIDCVNCENGGGAAEATEAYCCAHGFGCQGASAQASSDAAAMHIASPTVTGASPTDTGGLTTTTKASDADSVAISGAGLVFGQLLAWGLI
ncbi:MAG: hypothetical protein GOMPHAMPRED_004376 [Gomphillus americanus]|uniref:Uncharacterized protein n=1 Tax=Gomphillus americanus TaxID=1940652 RepID=A0A8H3FK00_9LECA|nr:MAG: hypothetical protein GOMPHAMPRED_004376 [Gomphillus americanus]